MIEYKFGCIFETSCQTITNTVNTVGVMGAGLALVFKALYPKMFKIYKEYCDRGQFRPGMLWIYKGSERWPQVLNFPTKLHWKNPSTIPIIEDGLKKLVETYKEKGITSLAIPVLGTNNGRLDPRVVVPVMEHYLRRLDIPVEIWTHKSDSVNPIWEELRNSCVAGRSRFEDLVLSSNGFVDLAKSCATLGRKDDFGEEINKLIKIEK